jgi:pathogenesis-related protein 1
MGRDSRAACFDDIREEIMKTKRGLHAHNGLMSLTVFILAAFALSACGKTKTGPQGKSHVNPSAMTTAHNQWRAQVGAPNIRWSEKLVDVAQTWADSLKNDGCGFYHSKNGYGENLYKASPLMWSDGRRGFQDKTPREVTDSWGDEIKDYNYEKNSCSGVCGHYTQVVWKDTTEVGCAMSVCDDKSQLWVCSYSPAGNLVGTRPY